MKTRIVERRFWTTSDIRKVCIDNDLYTSGTNEEYEKMFKLAESLEPFAENLYLVAKDIEKHSEGQTVGNIMTILANIIRITYEVYE